MKNYLKYLIANLKNGNYTTGILIIFVLLIYITILSIALIYNKTSVNILSFLWLLVGGAICISWNNYWHEKNKK